MIGTKIKVKSMVKLLEEKLGDKWIYDRKAGYWRNKAKTSYVCYVASFYEDETSYYKELYRYYTDERPTERLYL